MLLAMAFAHIWGVLELVALASLTRTIRARTALAALAAGLYTCSLTAILLQFAWTRLAARLASKPLYEIVSVASYTLDPFIEELVKVMPLIVLIWMIPAVRRQWSTADCVLIGASSGAGFGLAENLFRYSGAVNQSASVNGGWEVVANVFSISQPTIPSFTTSLTSWLPSGAAGGTTLSSAMSPDHFNLHLEWSALAGLAVALIFLGRSNPGRAAGAMLWLYVGADHAANNFTLSGQTGMLSILAVPFNWLRGVLWLMPAAALVIAWWLDRPRQHGSRSPELALAGECQTPSRILGGLHSALARPPRSILWVENLIRLRRAYATNSSNQPNSTKGLQEEVIVLRDRIDRLIAELHAPAETNQGSGQADCSFFLRPQFFVWLVLMLPSVSWFVVGGFPQTVWLQSALKTPPTWIVVRALSFLALAWMGGQLVLDARRWPRVGAASLGEIPAASTLRLVGGAGAFLFGSYAFVLAVTAGAPDSRVLTNFHVLEAVASSQVIGTLLTTSVAVGLFPPVSPALGPLPSSSGDMSQEPELVTPQGEIARAESTSENRDSALLTGGKLINDALQTGFGGYNLYEGAGDATALALNEADRIAETDSAALSDLEKAAEVLHTHDPSFGMAQDFKDWFPGSIGAATSFADQYYHPTATTGIGKGADAISAAEMNLVFGASNPVVALADGLVNTIGDVASEIGYDEAGNAISSLSIGKHLSSAGRAIITLEESAFTGDSSGLMAFQQDSLQGKNGLLFQWAAEAGQSLADNAAVQTWLENGVLDAAQAERQILTTGAKAAAALLLGI